MEPKFQRTIEDFHCDNCGSFVKGSGYTNHCPKCLWSKHVDTFPGDRANDCKGMMQPIAIASKNGKYRILHYCLICKTERWNNSAEADSFDRILEVASSQANHEPRG